MDYGATGGDGTGLPQHIKNSVERIQRNDPGFTSYGITQSCLGRAGMIACAGALVSNSYVKSFGIVGDKMDDDAAFAFADMLQKNNTLTYFSLAGCGISEDGMVALMRAAEKTLR